MRLIAVALLLSACSTYGGIVSLARPDARLPPDELVGTWRAPDVLRCGSNGEERPTRFAWPYVFTVDSIPSGWLKEDDLTVLGVPDPTCEGQEPDTLEYLGNLVRLGGQRILEFRVKHTGSMAVPLLNWVRLGTRGDTVFVERLNSDSMEAWLRRSPGLTPHQVLSSLFSTTLVLTGDAEQLQVFVREAFADPAMVSPDTLVIVRDRPKHGSAPPS